MNKLKEFTDAELLIEFKKRFDKSVLYELNIDKILEAIGEKDVKKFIKELEKAKKEAKGE
jgi:hypothetical protein